MKTLQRLTVGICFFFTTMSFCTRSEAQVKASFSASSTTLNCPPQSVTFTDASTGGAVSWSWDFGDGSSSTVASPSHIYTTSGTFTVSLTVKDASNQTDMMQTTVTVAGPTVQYTKTVSTSCAAISVKFSARATGGSPLYYTWDFGDGKTSTSISTSTTHAYRGGAQYPVMLTVKDLNGCTAKVGETLTFGSIVTVLPSTPNTLSANRECVDAFGWTNYYYDNNTPDVSDDILLLSLNKKGNNIGTIGDGTFQVTINATQNAGTSQGILLNSPVITNPSGYYVMNRYWNVKPTTQPATPVGVRFYFNNQDITDINGTFPTHDAQFQDLIFYNTKNGNPDPTTNLNGATDIVSVFNGPDADETHWVYSYNGSGSHGAEFMVSSFAGGGAGVTVNGEALPLKLISFTGKAENNNVKLNWSVASEINVDRFEVEASSDGKTFTTIGKVASKGSTATINDYTLTDLKVDVEKAKFYKLATIDKDGKKSYSEIIRVSVTAASNAILVYPVPANGSVTIASKNIINKNCTVEVYNSLGLKVMKVNKTSPGTSFVLNTASLPAGRYRMIIFNDINKIGDANFVIVR